MDNKKRRGHGEGNIKQRGKNSFRISFYDVNGNRYSETVHGRETDASRRLRELLVNRDKGVLMPSGRITVADHLNNWLNGYIKTNTGLRTQDAVESIIRNHLIPNLGKLTLKQIPPQAIQSYYGKACEKLSSRSVHYHHRILKQAFNYAVRRGILGSNPCNLVDPPSPRGKSMRTLDITELEVLLDKAESNKFYPVIYTAVSTGLRQAELLGLRWRDIDLDLMSISVNQVLYKRRGVFKFNPPKTAHSRRHVSMTPKLALYLRKYKQEREALYREIGIELTLDSLVFCNISGKSVDPSSLTHTFQKIVKQAGLENVRFHDLRHTFASLMLLRGVHPKIVSEALGHASVAFTMDIYSHIIKGMQSDAMALLNDVIPSGKNNMALKNSANLVPIADIMLNQN